MYRPGMESGMSVKQAYPPRRAACGVHLSSVQPFPHGVCARTFLESRVASSKRVVGGGRAGTPSSLYFYYDVKGLHETYCPVIGGKTDL